MGKKTLTKADNPAETQDEMIAGLADKWRDKKGSLIMALHDVQSHYGYVPRDVARKLAHQLDVPLARIYEVITFYNYFKLTPPGKHRISICLGTACYLKGAPELIEEVVSLLGIKEGQTTSDGMFQLDVVRCLGCCGLAPVLTVSEEDGDKVYAKVARKQVAEVIAKYSKPGSIEKK